MISASILLVLHKSEWSSGQKSRRGPAQYVAMFQIHPKSDGILLLGVKV